MRFTLFVLLATILCSSSKSFRYDANWNSIDSRPLPNWFDQSKVGIFLHWGVFSVPSFGSEWFWNDWRQSKSRAYVNYMEKNYKPNFTYEEFAPQFTAEFFEPQKWANLFKKSGARYVVLTSKHHEGYTLWPSKYSFNWNSMDVGPKQDLVGELANAVRNENLRFGLYHSLFEWFNPLYLHDKNNLFKSNEFVKFKCRPEMEELVNEYKPDILWSDGDWEALDTYWNSTDFLAWLYNDSPVKDKVVVNDRWGIGTSCKHGGYYSCADRYNPGKLQQHKWENAMTIDKQSWGYRREASLSDYMTIEELIDSLVTTVSCGGNILINVGPTKDGKIIPIFEERLLQLGQWLDINGEAIYESSPWKYQNDISTKDIWYTQRENHVYGILLHYPEDGMINFGAIAYDQVSSIRLLGYDHEVVYTKNKTTNCAIVQFPDISPLEPIRYAYTFKFVFGKN